MADALDLSDDVVTKLRAVFEASPVMGQGNPDVTTHPMTRGECRAIRRDAGVVSTSDEACGARNMVLVFAADRSDDEARVCIDQYEFPNVPCEYPVVYAQAREAASACEALGKRLCDAHEWEGACAGDLREAEDEYAWNESRAMMRQLHNRGRERVWAYGTEKDGVRCATASDKTRGCVSGGWKECGSNTYPAGAFPACVSPFGVFDLHGNVAEHMSLPLAEAELGSRGGHGSTEMKGSWFFFGRLEAHPDDCRWRAPNWHGSTVLDDESHRNYHLGFRCCKDVPWPRPGR